MLIGSTWSSTVEGNMAARGFTGTSLSDLSDAIGIGSVSHVVGKTFVTVDSGLITATPSPGIGTGVGIVGLISAVISADLQSIAAANFGQAGISLDDLADSVADACVSEMGTALLTSSHPVVFSGTGTITPGTITVIPASWASSVESAGLPAMGGTSWSDLADAIGRAQANAVIATGTGTVTITGSGIPGIAGAGAGTGAIS